MDEQDNRMMHHSTQESLESSRSGKTSSWRNPDSGHYGSVTPYRAYKTKKGEYCREYSQTVTIGGKTQEAYGTECRRPDGTWEMTSRESTTYCIIKKRLPDWQPFLFLNLTNN